MDTSQRALAELYRATLVTVIIDGESVTASQAVARLGCPLHVITAWNPGDERPSREANDEANDRLRGDLLAHVDQVWQALGSSSDGAHAEESWAVVGLSRDVAMMLGRRYGQVAVFEIHIDRQWVISCDGTWSVSREIRPVAGP